MHASFETKTYNYWGMGVGVLMFVGGIILALVTAETIPSFMLYVFGIITAVGALIFVSSADETTSSSHGKLWISYYDFREWMQAGEAEWKALEKERAKARKFMQKELKRRN